MSSTTSYPKKLFYKIQEVANIVGVEPYVLRYWETKFPMLSPEKDGSDQRRYRQKDIELLLRIRELLYEEKYTIAGAVDRLKEEGGKGGRKAAKSRPNGAEAAALPPDVNSDTPGFEETGGLNEDQAARLRRIREELGLMRRELEQWRDEMSS